MAKSTTAEKMVTIGTFVKDAYVEGERDMETLNGIAFVAGCTKDTGIKFSEVAALVKAYGIAEGFIKTLEIRKEEYRAECKDYDLVSIVTWTELESKVAELGEKHDVSAKFAMDTMTSVMVAAEIYVPKKSTLTDWQEDTVKAFLANPKTSKQELENVIKAHVQNFEHYAHLVHGLCYALLNPVVVPVVEPVAPTKDKKDK